MKMSLLVIPLAILSAFLVAGCERLIRPDPSIPIVTPDVLHANSERYDGKVVTVDGYVEVGPERRFLEQTKPSEDTRPSASCITMFAAGRIMDDPERFNGNHVHLTGRYMADYSRLRYVNLGSCGVSGIDLDNDYVLRVLP